MTTPAVDALPHAENGTTVRFMKRYDTWPFRVTRAGFRCLGAMSPLLGALAAEQVFRKPRRHPRPSREHEWLRPAKPTRVRLGLGHVAAWSWGERGPMTLLVHGWEGRGSQLAAAAELLVARGHRVVTFDAPGHGDSPGRLSSLPEFVDAIWAVTRQFGRPRTIAAHSFGAAATIAAIGEGLDVQRLALLAPPADFGEAIGRFARVMGIAPHVRERLEAQLHDRFGDLSTMFRVADAVSRVDATALIVHDREDLDVPVDEGATVARRWTPDKVTLHLTSGLGHRKILRDPSVVQTVVDFVTAR